MGSFISAPTNLASPSAIGSTTPNTGAFTTLNTGNGAAGTPSIKFSGSGGANAGLFYLSPAVLVCHYNNAQVGIDDGANVRVQNAGSFAFSSTTSPLGTLDTILKRDASNTLALRNSTNAQTFRIYNTYTDASNYERGFMRWATNVLEIGAEAAGTGTQRQLRFPLGTVTASTPLSITQTWNSAGVTFTGLQFNATDTASASGSLLMDLRIGSASVYSFGKGTLKIQAPSGIPSTLAIYGTSANSTGGNGGPNCLDIFNSSGTRTAFIRQDGLIGSAVIETVDDATASLMDASLATANYPSGVNLNASSLVGWSSGSNWWNSKDTGLRRNAAGILEVNNGTAGTFRDLIVRNLRMSAPTLVPASASATGSEGQISWDASYIYVCTATNTWKRVAIATW